MFEVVDKVTSDSFKAAFKLEAVKTDTVVFRLHYKLSIWLIFLYSIAYVYVQLNNPISCMFANKNAIGTNPDVMNDFCWVHGAYSLSRSSTSGGQILSGVRGFTSEKETVTYHRYYIWMYFIIVCMIIMLQTPRQLWRCIESGVLKRLSDKIQTCTVLVRDEDIQKQEDNLAEYLICHMGYHKWYAFGFILCELLNTIVVVCLMIMLDVVTGHEFSMHGAASFTYINTPPIERTDPMSKAFPILGKCTFNKYGPSGNIVPYDGICVLPLNLINERAVVFFWYYFMTILTVDIIALVYRFVLGISRGIRVSILSVKTPMTLPEDVTFIVNKCTYSDWFILLQLSGCVEPVLFREVIEKFIQKVRAKEISYL
ncbi:Innexin inx2 [Orchesella cincta]|uniref:Innexin n=1 Tax=Orchesella cincta TaxID=48709 RepID=A0A1D2MTY0_ORCCI|nr:Innexin inx2 [Orchesella cincta]